MDRSNCIVCTIVAMHVELRLAFKPIKRWVRKVAQKGAKTELAGRWAV